MTCYLRQEDGSRPDAYCSNVLEHLSDSSKDSQDFPLESDQNSSKVVIGVSLPCLPCLAFGFIKACSPKAVLPL